MNSTISIKRMFIIMTCILFGMTIFSVLGGLFGLSHFRGALEFADNSNVLLRAQSEGDMMHGAMRADYFAGMLAAERDDAAAKKAIRDDFAEHRKKWDEALSTMKQAVKSPELMRAVADIEPAIKNYIAESGRLVDLTLTDAAGARRRAGARFRGGRLRSARVGAALSCIGEGHQRLDRRRCQECRIGCRTDDQGR